MYISSITSLDKRRSKVLFEEGFALVLYQGDLRKYQMKEGAEITEEQYHEILKEVLCKRARVRVLHLLKQSDKTELQLRRKLREGGYPEVVIDDAVRYVKEYGYVDDEKYGIRYIETYGKRKSKRQIVYVLQQKGLSKELISRLLEEQPADEEALVRAYLKKKGYGERKPTAEEYRKVMSSLVRKGVSYQVIRQVAGESFEDE